MALKNKVGIDAIAVYAPVLRLSAGELAKARVNGTGSAEELRLKYEKGLGVRSIAVADADEDAASMAATAMMKLMRRAEIGPKDVSAVFAATESSFDNSKPIFTYVMDAIEMRYGSGSTMHIRTDERKFACVSGMGAIEDALNYAAVKGKAVIVVTSDIAKYELRSAGEPTSGAGAAALLIRPNPSILSIDPLDIAYASKNEYDFFKPFVNGKESVMFGKETPVVNGHYSQYVYMSMTYKAYEELEKKLAEKGENPAHAEYFVAHVPFQKMAQKGFALFLAHNLRENYPEEWKKATIEMGPKINLSPGIMNCSVHESLEIATAVDKLEHSLKNWDHDESYRKSFWHNAAHIMETAIITNMTITRLPNGKITADYDGAYSPDGKPRAEHFLAKTKEHADAFVADLDSFIKAFSATTVYRENYKKKVESGLAFSGDIGNIYTGSIMLSLASLIHNEQKNGANLNSKRIILLGYGSGSEAVAMAGQFSDSVKPLENDVAETRALSAAEYEGLHRGTQEGPIDNDSGGKEVRLGHISEERIRTYSLKRD